MIRRCKRCQTIVEKDDPCCNTNQQYDFTARQIHNIHKQMTLPTDSQERKNYPIMSGVVNYFPAALAGVAYVSKTGNDKHNPGQPLHHNRSKSMDHGDCILRHLIDTEDLLARFNRNEQVTSNEILTEANQMAWRALAYSQMLHEKFGAPKAPGAKDD